MKPEDILNLESLVLSQDQREFYFENGYLLVENAINEDWLKRLRATIDEVVDETRALTESDKKWDLEAGHTAENPRLRRLSSPNDHHPVFLGIRITVAHC
ncbi:phytanoyl-CoA dioxygenase family protein [Rhodospirillales bacterium]|nr:phytanoyl-CoA dioxygenase family protein [Rhodospirillales bacterium]